MWTFHNMREKCDEITMKFFADDVDNIRNNVAEGRRIFYNTLAECDTTILMGPQLAARGTHMTQDQTK